MLVVTRPMSPKTAAQNEIIRRQTRQKILDTALNLFACHGYSSTTIRMIAAESGIAIGLLYNYFSGKEGLLRAIFMTGVADIQASFVPIKTDQDPYTRLKGLIGSSLDLIRAHKDFWKLFYSIRLQPAVMEMLSTEVSALSQQLNNSFSRHFQLLNADHPEAEARIFIAIIDGIGNHYVLDPQNYPLDEVKQAIIHKYCHPSKP